MPRAPATSGGRSRIPPPQVLVNWQGPLFGGGNSVQRGLRTSRDPTPCCFLRGAHSRARSCSLQAASGRGLRPSAPAPPPPRPPPPWQRACLTVLDFIGQGPCAAFATTIRYRALLGGSRESPLRRKIEAGFPSSPPACPASSSMRVLPGKRVLSNLARIACPAAPAPAAGPMPSAPRGLLAGGAAGGARHGAGGVFIGWRGLGRCCSGSGVGGQGQASGEHGG